MSHFYRAQKMQTFLLPTHVNWRYFCWNFDKTYRSINGTLGEVLNQIGVIELLNLDIVERR